jgi:hypothetical protein
MKNDDYCNDCPNPAGCYAMGTCAMPDAKEKADDRLPLTTGSAWPETPGFYWWRGAPSFRWEMMQVLAYGAEDDQSRYMVQKVEARQVMRSLHVWKERGPACGEWVKIPLPNR